MSERLRIPRPKKVSVPRPLEKDVQKGIVRLFRSMGGIVHSTSQYRASHVTEGMPDLHNAFPFLRAWFWFETKRPLATAEFHPFKPYLWTPEPLRPSQEEFRQNCLATGAQHFWGGLKEAEDALISIGAAERVNGVLRLTPRGRAAK